MFSSVSTNPESGRNGTGKSVAIGDRPPVGTSADALLRHVADFASGLAQRYELSSLAPLLASCRSAISRTVLKVAVVGRFKAGKSSFINHLTGRSILPVGVVPVTAVVTEIRFGLSEKASVQFLDGRVQEVSLDEIGGYVSERENPGNGKLVNLISVDLPELTRFQGLEFVDTPGLDSALTHNTEAATKWLPNVGLALVAVSVDPPLSQQDIDLLKKLYQFTPNVSVLVTKVDLLGPEERAEVLTFIDAQLARVFDAPPPTVPYSVRPGYEDLKAELEQRVLQPALAGFGEQRRAIAARKLDTLLRDCSGYVTLSLKSAELLGSERGTLKRQLLGRNEVVADVKEQMNLIARQLAAGTRAFTEARLETHQKEIEGRLLQDLGAAFPGWTGSLAHLLDSFDGWLNAALAAHLSEVSLVERGTLCEPLRKVRKQMCRILQDFRDRLSEGAMRALGVPLSTTEVEFEIHEPKNPNIKIGRIFDRNWELLSPIAPMALIKPIVRRHFAGEVPYILRKNLSRLGSQWEESVHAALTGMRAEAERRLDEFGTTVEHLIEKSPRDRLPAIRQDLEDIESLRQRIAPGQAILPNATYFSNIGNLH